LLKLPQPLLARTIILKSFSFYDDLGAKHTNAMLPFLQIAILVGLVAVVAAEAGYGGYGRGYGGRGGYGGGYGGYGNFILSFALI
jgi:hypothetical protein